MGGIRIVLHIGILYLFYMIGVWIQQSFSLVIPGSIIGMILLFILLVTKIFNPKWIEQGTSLLLGHMPLLFLPVMVGILNYLDIFTGRGIVLVFITFVSSVLVFVVSGKISDAIALKGERENG